MKISETSNSPAELVSQHKISDKKAAAEAGKQAAAGVIAEEKVSLSSQARDLHEAKKAVEALPEVRSEKVRELKEQIEAERYTINGEKIAEKMVSESLLDILV